MTEAANTGVAQQNISENLLGFKPRTFWKVDFQLERSKVQRRLNINLDIIQFSTPRTYFTPFSSVSIADFEDTFVCRQGLHSIYHL